MDRLIEIAWVRQEDLVSATANGVMPKENIRFRESIRIISIRPSSQLRPELAHPENAL
jgi:hypothetical protein